jgi:hypothetical protein
VHHHTLLISVFKWVRLVSFFYTSF